MKLLQPTVGVRHRLKLSLGVSFASQTGNFFKIKNKKVNKNGFSFQSGPNPMSFAFKRGVGTNLPIFFASKEWRVAFWKE